MDNPRAVSEVRPLFKKCRVEAPVANPSRLRVESHLGSFGKVLAKRIRNRSVPSLNPRSKRLRPRGKPKTELEAAYETGSATPSLGRTRTRTALRPGKTSTIMGDRLTCFFAAKCIEAEGHCMRGPRC